MNDEDHISSLLRIIESLKKSRKQWINKCSEVNKENQQLKNNWNELKKYTYRVIETDNELYGTWLLQEMKRLESSVDNE